VNITLFLCLILCNITCNDGVESKHDNDETELTQCTVYGVIISFKFASSVSCVSAGDMQKYVQFVCSALLVA